MKKILVAFLFLLIGFYTPSFIEWFDMDSVFFELMMFLPYVGIPLAIWGMFEKKNK
ncbi:MAG: hypothetical protein J6L71_02755 [Clostridia bacterium]|nr:hypothetical protein [Clostridia bacterium]